MAVIAGTLCRYWSFYETHKQKFNLVLLTLIFWSYLLLGGFIFKTIEGSQDVDEPRSIAEAKQIIMKKHPAVPNEAMDDLFRELTKRGVKGLRTDNSTIKWTFGNSVLFSVTLLTTVGYGHLSPVSPVGKVMCMIYTTIGIPLALYIMAMYVNVLTRWSDCYRETLFTKFRYHLTPSTIHTIHAIISSMLVISISILVPASIFDYLEVQWNYLDSLYFCFITLTTVGLGDFVPGLNTNHPYVDLYRFGATVYILFGVTAIMFLLAIASEYVINIQNCWHRSSSELLIPSEKEGLIVEDVPSYGTLVVRTVAIPEGDTRIPEETNRKQPDVGICLPENNVYNLSEDVKVYIPG